VHGPPPPGATSPPYTHPLEPPGVPGTLPLDPPVPPGTYPVPPGRPGTTPPVHPLAGSVSCPGTGGRLLGPTEDDFRHFVCLHSCNDRSFGHWRLAWRESIHQSIPLYPPGAPAPYPPYTPRAYRGHHPWTPHCLGPTPVSLKTGPLSAPMSIPPTGHPLPRPTAGLAPVPSERPARPGLSMGKV